MKSVSDDEESLFLQNQYDYSCQLEFYLLWTLVIFFFLFEPKQLPSFVLTYSTFYLAGERPQVGIFVGLWIQDMYEKNMLALFELLSKIFCGH